MYRRGAPEQRRAVVAAAPSPAALTRRAAARRRWATRAAAAESGREGVKSDKEMAVSVICELEMVGRTAVGAQSVTWNGEAKALI